MKKIRKIIIIILSVLCLSALLVAVTQRLNIYGTYINENKDGTSFLVIKNGNTIRWGKIEGKLLKEDGQYYIEYEVKAPEINYDTNEIKEKTTIYKYKIEFVDYGLILNYTNQETGEINSSYFYQKLK